MEQIYTIPINEAFENCEGKNGKCALCEIYDNFDKNETEIILGASMMEPDIRKKTNEQGFCGAHYEKMLLAGKKLPVALMLESHLSTVAEKVRVNRFIPGKSVKGSVAKIGRLSKSCYICNRLDENFAKVLDNAVYLWVTDEAFKKKVSSQSCFCLPHYAAFLGAAKEGMSSSDFSAFSSSVRLVEEKYLEKVRENVSFFVKKFDYRYENEPWGDAKDAVEKAVGLLSGKNFS